MSKLTEAVEAFIQAYTCPETADPEKEEWEAYEKMKEALRQQAGEGECSECHGTGINPNVILTSNPPQPMPCSKGCKPPAPSEGEDGLVFGGKLYPAGCVCTPEDMALDKWSAPKGDREQAIREASEEEYDEWENRQSFICGARWADANPERRSQ